MKQLQARSNLDADVHAFHTLVKIVVASIILSACSSQKDQIEYAQRGDLIVIDAGVWSDSLATGEQSWRPARLPLETAPAETAALLNKKSPEVTPVASTPTLYYNLNVSSTGQYSIWVLAKSTADTRASIIFGADQGEQQWEIEAPTSDWSWINTDIKSSNLFARVDNFGVHQLALKSNSAGIMVSRIILSLDPTFVPQDHGPESTLSRGSDALDDSTVDPGQGNSTAADTTTPSADNGVTDQNADDTRPTTVSEDSLTQSNAATLLDGMVSISGDTIATAGEAASFTATLVARDELTGPVSFFWSIVHGPGSISVNAQHAADTTITFSSAGQYDIQVSAVNGTTYTNAIATVNVNPPATGNTQPVLDKPADVTATVNIPAWLPHHATDDGLAATQLNYYWSKLNGPGDVTFSDVSTAGTRAAFSLEGHYTLQLNATDGLLNTNTLVTVQVSAALSTQTEFASQWIPVDGQGTAQARHETGGVVIDGKIYMIGGRGHKHIDIYDLESNRWTRTIKTPIEMHHFQPVAIGTKIYLLGGMTCCYPQEKSIEHVQIFDTRTRKWSEGAKIPAKRRRGGAGAAVYKDKIYLLGGNTKGHSGGAVNWFDEFDPQTGKWKALKNAPDARDHANIAIIGSKLVAAGGRKSAHPNTFANTVRQTNVYDFETGNWQRAAAIPTQRAGTMTVAVGSEVIVLGGESIRQRTAHREVEAFDVNTGKWRTLTPLSIARHSGVAVVSGDYIHVVAGAVSIGGRNETNQHEKLKFR